MSFITYSNNNLPSVKHLKFYKESVVLVQGVKTNTKLDLCDLKLPYDQYDNMSFVLGKSMKNRRLDFTTLGQNVTTVILKATYDKTNIDTVNNYVNYILDGDLGDSKLFSNIMILSGTSNRPVPSITLSNPSDKYSIKVDVISISVDTDITIENPAYDLVITGLNYSSIKTLTQSESVGVYNSSNNIVQSIQLSSIGNININGNTVEIDDSATGTIGLQFNSEFDARQLFSAINWLLNDTNTRSLPQSIDNTPPVIVYNNTIISNVAPNTTLSTYTTGFTKQDAITLCINNVYDNRDGAMSNNEVIVDFSQSDIKFNKITVTGTYFITFKLTDLAGNENIKIVQITFI